jgi:glycosyltransferase involved in cell wall biosynthesis
VTAKLRVLAVTNTYPTDETPGDTPAIRDEIVALRAQGVEVELLHIDRHKGKLRSYAKAAWRLFLTSFQSKRYDLIHAYYGHCGLLARLQIRYPVVTTFRGSDLLSRKDGAIGKIAARSVEGVIVRSEEMKRASKRKDAHIIPGGVNLGLFTPYPMEHARRDLGLPLSDKLLLFPWDPARPEKRFDIVQDAIRSLQKEDEKVRLMVVFNKPHEIVAKYMNACNALVLASDHEGAPMAVREAMACNLPIVSVDVGDVRQIIGDTEGCFLCKREAGDLAEKLRWALNRRERTNGRRVVRKMDIIWAAEQVISVYNLILNERDKKVGER